MRRLSRRHATTLVMFSTIFLCSLIFLPALRANPTPNPILVVVNDTAANPFGRYLGEILRAEGLNAFDVTTLDTLTTATLAGRDLTILAETPLDVNQATTLRSYVTGGGHLLALRPDAQLRDLFGLDTAAGTQTDGYLAIDPAAQFAGTATGAGLPSTTLQIHGNADYYTTSALATTIARLYTTATAPTSYPAVVAAAYGNGQAAAFTYDLARNVIMTRQGNPANANVDVDGDGVLRTIDLFQAAGGGSWVDRNRIPVPQADEQQRLFARLVRQLVAPVRPLPQLWYFPGNTRTMLIPTGDAHANPTSYYQQELTSIHAHGGNITLYITIAADPNNATVNSWLAQGDTVGIHPPTNKPDTYQPYNITSLAQGYDVYTNWYATTFSSPKSRTVRNHQVAWKGWTDSADYAAAKGLALDTDFYHWGPWIQKADGSWPMGYITGSGRPMKFVRADGTIIPVYQQLTELVDEHMLAGVPGGYAGLSSANGIAASRQLIDASQAGDYAALMTQFHVDYYGFGFPQTWAEGTMDYARSLNIPIWNADRWLQFTETRDAATYSNILWNDAAKTLSFDLNAPATAGITLTTLLPMNYGGSALQAVTVGGVATPFTVQTIKGVAMGFVSVPAGNRSVSASYGFPSAATNTPLVTNTPINQATSTPTNSPVPATATSAPATATSAPATATSAPATATSAPATATSAPATATQPVATATSLLPTSVLPTATPALTSGSLTQTSLADFTQACAVQNGALGSTAGGGSVTLAGAFADDFSTLNLARWSAGNWSGGAYTPDVSNGTLNVQVAGGGWVRSVNTFSRAAMEFDAEFGAASFQHVGFASNGFEGNRYLIFSTFGGDGNLYARANNNASEQNSNLGPLPTGMHRYRIEWSAADASNDRATFFVDGTLRATFTIPNAGASNFFFYVSNASASVPLRLDAAQVVPSYVATGTYASCLLDAGIAQTWTTFAWDALLPAATNVGVQVRTSSDGLTWSDWSVVATSGDLLAAPARYLQYALLLSTTDTQVSPQINAVTLTYATASLAATATSVPATATATSVPPTVTDTATATSVPPTATSVPPTATSVPPTVTSVPPTATNTATATSVPPTATSVPPTATAVPPTATAVPPTATATVTPIAYRTADKPTNPVSGLRYNYYAGAWTALPNFSALTPASTGTVTNFSLTPRLANSNFGFRFTGYVSVPADGIYTFYTNSDAGSRLYIGTTLVVDNDGLHTALERSGQIALRAGLHALTVDYFETNGTKSLTVSYQSTTITKRAIPNTALYR